MSIPLSATYPERTIALNLGGSGGRIATTAPSDTARIRIENASGLASSGPVSNYWNRSGHAYRSNAIVYRPVFTFYSGAPRTYYEHSIVYNRYPSNTTVRVTDQSLIDGRRVSLIALQGNLSRSGHGVVSLDPAPASVSTNTIAIRNDTHPVTITLPTELSADQWKEVLDEELKSTGDGGHVVEVRQAGDHRVTIVLERGVTYEFRLAKIGVGSGADSEPPTYLTVTDPPDATITRGSTHRIPVEVRDRFNNPVAGVPVTMRVIGNGALAGSTPNRTVVTRADGQAQVTVTANETGTGIVEFHINDGSARYERTQVTVQVVPPYVEMDA